jgi:hypothetical protein
MKPGRIVLLVCGVVVAFVAMGLLAGGIGTLWLRGAYADADGFLTSPAYQLASEGYALTTPDIDLQAAPGEWTPWIGSPDTRLTVTAPAPSQEVFVGIGDARDVAAYLEGVAHDEVMDLGDAVTDIEYAPVAGNATPAPPAAQDFWVVQQQGSGTQAVTWEPSSGEWAAVIMNADGAPNVSVAATGGIAGAVLTPIGTALLVAGAVVLIIAAAMILIATAGSGRTPTTAPTGPPQPSTYPLTIEGRLDEPLNRGLWLVKWLLAIPHYVVLGFLWIAAVVATLVAGFGILFTGRYPRALFEFNVGVMRWTWRVAFYSFTLATDRYPPFTLAPADYPATLDVAYPQRLSRGLWIVKGLLAIPHLIIVGVFAGGAATWALGPSVGDNWQVATSGGLIGLLAIIAGVLLLFTGSYPRGLFDFSMGMSRWVYRVMAYTWLMTDHYPPFRLDSGGSEPPAAPAEPAGPQGDRSAEQTLAAT